MISYPADLPVAKSYLILFFFFLSSHPKLKKRIKKKKKAVLRWSMFIFHIPDFPFAFPCPLPSPVDPPSPTLPFSLVFFYYSFSHTHSSRWYSNFNLFQQKKEFSGREEIFLVFLLGCFHFLTILFDELGNVCLPHYHDVQLLILFLIPEISRLFIFFFFL